MSDQRRSRQAEDERPFKRYRPLRPAYNPVHDRFWVRRVLALHLLIEYRRRNGS
jgi:hypothetical protein